MTRTTAPKTTSKYRVPKPAYAARLLVIFSIVFLVLAVPSLIAYREYQARLLEESRQHVAQDLASYKDVLELQLSERLGQLNGLTAFLLISHTPSELTNEFDSFARGLVSRDPGIRAVEIAPNAIITYVYPREGNEAAIGADLLHDKRVAVQNDIKRGIATKKTIVGGPYELLQGGSGFVAREPLFNPDGSFYATTQIVFNVSQLIKETGLDNKSTSLNVALRTKSGDVLYQKADVFGADPVVYKVYVPGGYWEVAAVPKGGWAASVANRQISMLAGGTIIVLLLSIIVTGVLDRQRYLTQAVAYRTMELEHAASFPRQNPSPIVEFDQTGALIFNNSAATQKLQQAGQDGKYDLFKPADYRTLMTSMASNRTRAALYREVKVGESFFAESIVPSDEPGGMRVYTIEITDKKQYENDLVKRQEELIDSYKKLDRSLTMYTVLGEISENTLRIHDRKRLSQAVCRILVENADYSWAAILMKDKDKLKTYTWLGKPADFKQSLDKYLEHLTPDNPMLGDLMEKAKNVICIDMRDSKVTPAWREMNARAGFAISGAFPLVINGAAVGALIAFSGDPGL